jgi:uncharacterized radical SAM superfamily Fe-S cluster-containing enzyme
MLGVSSKKRHGLHKKCGRCKSHCTSAEQALSELNFARAVQHEKGYRKATCAEKRFQISAHKHVSCKDSSRELIATNYLHGVISLFVHREWKSTVIGNAHDMDDLKYC